MPVVRWGIVGVGVAGRARAKAIASDPRATLVAVWRGRYAAETGVPSCASFEELLAGTDAVAICSPTDQHPAQARTALDAGRHTLVEFPMAPDAATAEALFAHATARGLVLHEEHIELLDAPTGTLRAHVRPDTVRSIAITFERPGPEGATAAELALGNVARLHRVAAVAGPFERIEHVHAEPGRLVADIVLRTGAPVRATFQQAPYFSRRTVMDLDTVAARWTQIDEQLLRDGMPVTLVGLGGLFVRDQRSVTARILDGAPSYVSENRILHVMDVVDLLGSAGSGPIPHRSDAGTPG